MSCPFYNNRTTPDFNKCSLFTKLSTYNYRCNILCGIYCNESWAIRFLCLKSSFLTKDREKGTIKEIDMIVDYYNESKRKVLWYA